MSSLQLAAHSWLGSYKRTLSCDSVEDNSCLTCLNEAISTSGWGCGFDSLTGKCSEYNPNSPPTVYFGYNGCPCKFASDCGSCVVLTPIGSTGCGWCGGVDEPFCTACRADNETNCAIPEFCSAPEAQWSDPYSFESCSVDGYYDDGINHGDVSLGPFLFVVLAAPFIFFFGLLACLLLLLCLSVCGCVALVGLICCCVGCGESSRQAPAYSSRAYVPTSNFGHPSGDYYGNPIPMQPMNAQVYAQAPQARVWAPGLDNNKY